MHLIKKNWYRFVLSTLFLMAGVPLHATITLTQSKLGNVFLTTETVQFPLTCSGNEVAWVAKDFFGATVGQGSVTPSGGAATIQPNLNRRGYFDLELTEKSNGSTISTKKTAFAVLTSVDVSTMANSPFGTMTHFAQFSNPDVMPVLARGGFAHIRDEQYWGAIETTQGQYTFPSQYTNYMSAAAAQQITPMIALDWSNHFYDYDNGDFTAPYTENGRTGYANYTKSVLNQYGSQIKAVEIWNEYNGQTFVQGPATANKPQNYYLMLKKAYEGMKSIRPDIKVLGGSTVPIAHGFFKDIFDQGAMPYMDAASIHPYRRYADSVDLDISELKALIRSYNNGVDKPIWATEFQLGSNSVAEQYPAATYLAQITTLMLSQGVEKMYYYVALDDGTFPNWGLLSSSGDAKGKYTPHPTYVAYANVIRQLSTASYQSRYSGTKTSTYAFKFIRGSDVVTVLWSRKPVTVSLNTASAVTVTDIMGQETSLSPTGGVVSLEITENPVYVKGPVTGVSDAGNTLIADSLSGYTKTQGQNGWSYGYANLGSSAAFTPSNFQPMTWGIWSGNSYSWLGTSTYHFVTSDQMHPSGAWAIRRWVSTNSGTVTLTGRVVRSSGGDGVNLRIFVEGTEVYSRHVNPDEDFTYSVPNVNVVAGNRIDFTINQNTENSFDSTSMTAQVVLQQAPQTYALTVNSGSGGGNYTAGSAVNVTANTAPAGQVFSAWTGSIAGLASATSASTTLTMSAAAASITATYVPMTGGNDKIRFYPRAGYPDRMVGGVFEGTDGDPVTGTYTAIYTIATQPAAAAWTEVNVSLGTYRYLRYRAGNSSWCNVAEVEFYRSGTKLTGTSYGTAGSFNNLGDTLVKVFDGNTATYFDSTQPAGAYAGIDTVGGSATYALTVNSGTGGGTYAAGTAVPVTANTPPAGQIFSAWTGSTSALANPSSASTTLTMPAAAASITATYVTAPVTYALTVNGGTGSGNYASGTVVNVTANTAPAGQVFSAWTGNTAGLASTTSASTTLTMPASAAAITATYVPTSGADKIRYYPRVSNGGRMVGGIFEGTNGNPDTGTYTVLYTITTQPPEAWTEVNASLGTYRYLRYRAPTSGFGNVAEVEFYRGGVKLSGTPFGTPGSFQNLGDTFVKVYDGNTSTYFDSTQPNGAYAGIDTGTSTPATYALTVNSGTGGGSYASGTVVNVTANTPPAGQSFSAWTGNTSGLASTTSANTTLTMPAAAASITATYVNIPANYVLTVNSGSGGGSYIAGTVVNVSANTPPAGQVFSAWTGNTAGLASTTSANTTLTMPAAAASITATYVPTGGNDKVRFYPRSGYPDRMTGGVFEGTSGDPVTGTYTVITTIATQPAASAWTEINVGLGSYRYLRYRAPSSSFCNVAEVEVYRNGVKLTGTGYGTAGSYQSSGLTFDKALDGSITTYFDSSEPHGAYVGLDTGASGPATYALTVTSGTGGGSYAAATVVNVSANTPPSGKIFVAWTGTTSALASASSATTTLTMPAAAAAITATYGTSGGGGSLPSPWTSTDIGSPAPTGSATYNSGTYTVLGGGSDIWDASDSFRYVYKPLTGDGQIVAKIESMTNTSGWAKAGVMFRSSLASGANNVFAAVTPDNVFTMQTRNTNNASTTNNALPALGAPRWARIVRVGDVFTVSHSADGVTWTVVGSSTVVMPSTIYVGLALTSHASGVICTATFSNVSP